MATTVYRPSSSSTGDASITGDVTVTGAATVSSDVTIDTNTLYVDATNNRVGVVNLTPAVPLDVVGNIRSSTGILFGSDTAAANLLDDYEEGSWTPTIQDSTKSDAEGQAYSVQVGRYTKIGNLVHVQGRVAISDLGTLTTSEAAFLAGLPFTSNSTTDNFSVLNVGWGTSLAIAAETAIGGYVDTGTTTVVLQLWDVVTGTSGLLISEISVGGSIIFSGSYQI